MKQPPITTRRVGCQKKEISIVGRVATRLKWIAGCRISYAGPESIKVAQMLWYVFDYHPIPILPCCQGKTGHSIEGLASQVGSGIGKYLVQYPCQCCLQVANIIESNHNLPDFSDSIKLETRCMQKLSLITCSLDRTRWKMLAGVVTLDTRTKQRQSMSSANVPLQSPA